MCTDVSRCTPTALGGAGAALWPCGGRSPHAGGPAAPLGAAGPPASVWRFGRCIKGGTAQTTRYGSVSRTLLGAI